MFCGSSTEVGSPEDELKATACWIEILSKDNSWTKYGPIETPGKKFGCIEPSLYWNEEGHLEMLCRDRANRIGLEGWIWTATSKDNGKTWSVLKKTTLPNPDTGIETISLSNGKTFVFYNHSHTDRHPLALAIFGYDENSWIPLCILEEESGEFPSATFDSQGHLHVIYAWTPIRKTQRRIKHIVIDFIN